MYYQLFNAITDAIEETEKMNFGQVKSILIQAQQKCEEMYFSETLCDVGLAPKETYRNV